MLRRSRPQKDPAGTWVYPWSEDVLDECGLVSIDKYIRRQRQTIVEYVATRPLFAACWKGEREQGTPHHQWWWDKEMSLDEDGLILEHSNDGSVDTLEFSSSCGG